MGGFELLVPEDAHSAIVRDMGTDVTVTTAGEGGDAGGAEGAGIDMPDALTPTGAPALAPEEAPYDICAPDGTGAGDRIRGDMVTVGGGLAIPAPAPSASALAQTTMNTTGGYTVI